MRFTTCCRVSISSLLFAFALTALPAHAQQGAVVQTLDRVSVFSKSKALEMNFDEAARPPDYTDLGLNGSSRVACKLTPVGGMFCLDGNTLRNWPNPKSPGVYVDILSCTNSALGLSGSSPCSGMTVDDSGAIWLAGKKSSYSSYSTFSYSEGGGDHDYSYSLIKIVAKVGSSCPEGWSLTASYCAREYYSGLDKLTDLDAIDGVTGKLYFPDCGECSTRPGILAIDGTKTVKFFPSIPDSAPVLVGGASAWGLDGYHDYDELQSVTLLTVDNDGLNPYVLVTTKNGKIRAKRATQNYSVVVFNIPGNRSYSAAQCTWSGQQRYGIRASSRTDTVYVTDRNYCQVLALLTNTPSFTALIFALDVSGARRIRSTGAIPPEGLTLAAGIIVNLDTCSVSCTVLTLNNSTGTGTKVAASLKNVALLPGSATGVTFFQIKGIPDCRYAGRAQFPNALKQICIANQAAVIVDPYNTGIPAAQRLNVTPLLPVEVTSLFAAGGGLPALLISAQHRGQLDNSFKFDAFFAVTAAGMKFKDTFETQYDIPVLEQRGTDGGCVPVPGDLLRWDVTTTVSEKVPSVGGKYVDMLTNVGCINPTRTSAARLSLLPYNLEISPDTYGPTVLHPFNASLTVGNDAVFARLLQSMYTDLGEVLDVRACPLLTSTQCRNLQGTYALGRLKLELFVAGAFLPKNIVSQTLCSLFSSVLTSFRSALPTTPAADAANRIGELKTRSDAIRHVFDTRFLPSIPNKGFCREKHLSNAACPYPWPYPTS